jgi:hypothetical protein
MHEFLATVSDECSLTVFDAIGLKEMIKLALDRTQSWEKKKCALRAPLMMTLILSMALNRHLSIYDVFKKIVRGLRMRARRRGVSLQSVTEEAVYHARVRLGIEPVKVLFELTAEKIDSNYWFHGLRTNAIDGFFLTTPDTEANEEFFHKPECPNGEAAFPQLKGVALVDTENRGMRALVVGPYYMAEQGAAEELLKHLGTGDFLVIDRGLPSYGLFSQCNAADVRFMARIPSGWYPEPEKKLGPGDQLVRIHALVPAKPEECRQWNQKNKTEYMTVRMIEYTFKSTGETIRLLTDLLDPKEFPAIELAMFYHERWEIELVYDEFKTHLETVLHGSTRTIFRSKTPDGVLQEVYGMAAVYNMIRITMAQAARRVQVSPDEISFVGTLNQLRDAELEFAAADSAAIPLLRRQLLRDIGEDRVDRPRRKRVNPRVVKTPLSKFPRKKARHQGMYFDAAAELVLVDSDPERFAA